MKIAIRADGGKRAGMGHIMRTLVLAEELAETNVVFYVCKNKEEFMGGINKVKEKGFEVRLIDADNALSDLLKIDADILITDSYEIEDNYFESTKNHFGKTVYIDDRNDRNYYDVDIIINQNIGTEKWEYNCPANCIKLLGRKNALLRKEFRESEPIEIKPDVENILITMGGSDPLDATKKLICMLKDVPKVFHVVIGKNFKDQDYYKEFAEKHKNFIFHYDPDMLEVMKKCDIAISACGSTVYELSALGIPVLGIIVADNQEKIAEIGDSQKLLISLGHIETLKKEKLLDALRSLYDYNLRKSFAGERHHPKFVGMTV